MCQLMRTAGKMLSESQRAAPLLSAYIERLTKLSQDRRLALRFRFLCRDVIELRDNNWVARREELKAKKLTEVHREGAEPLGSASPLGLSHHSSQGDSEDVLFPAFR